MRIGVAAFAIGWAVLGASAQSQKVKENTPVAPSSGTDPIAAEAQQLERETKPSSETATSNTESVEQTEKEKAAALAAQIQIELDKLILGPWAIVTKEVTSAKVTEASLKAATVRCLAPFGVKKLDIEPGAERKFPKPQEMLGDLVYFRTSKGLQRFDSASGRMYLLNGLRKAERNNRTVWVVRGRTAGFRIRFANSKKRPERAQLMLEENTLYLRCGFLKARFQNQQNGG